MNTKWVLMLAFIPALILLAAVVFFTYELREIRKENQVLIQELLKTNKEGGVSAEAHQNYLKGAVKNTIVRHAQSIQSCFLSLIESNPDIPESGRALVDWQIDPGGKVFEAGVIRDEFSNKEFQTCVGSEIGDIVFPATPSGRSVYVEHTFVFRKEENT